MATHKGMPCRIDCMSMSFGLRVDVRAHTSVVKDSKSANWLEKGSVNPPHCFGFLRGVRWLRSWTCSAEDIMIRVYIPTYQITKASKRR